MIGSALTEKVDEVKLSVVYIEKSGRKYVQVVIIQLIRQIMEKAHMLTDILEEKESLLLQTIYITVSQ